MSNNRRAFWLVVVGAGEEGAAIRAFFALERGGRALASISERLFYIGDYLGRPNIFHQVDDVGVDEEESSGTRTVS